MQGTLYPDVIESCPPPGSGQKHSHTIKSHHNVGGLPKDLDFTLIEPLRELFKVCALCTDDLPASLACCCLLVLALLWAAADIVATVYAAIHVLAAAAAVPTVPAAIDFVVAAVAVAVAVVAPVPAAVDVVAAVATVPATIDVLAAVVATVLAAVVAFVPAAVDVVAPAIAAAVDADSVPAVALLLLLLLLMLTLPMLWLLLLLLWPVAGTANRHLVCKCGGVFQWSKNTHPTISIETRSLHTYVPYTCSFHTNMGKLGAAEWFCRTR